jgi:hypothetical protein
MNRCRVCLTLTGLAIASSVGLLAGLASAQSSYDVNKSQDTAHVAAQPPRERERRKEPEGETKTILLPTWPVQVPARVSKGTADKPDNPHAGENRGAAEGLGGGK